MDMMTGTIPDGPDDLSPGWLTAALRAAGVIGPSSISELESVVVGADRGFTGVVTQVLPTYDRPALEAPATLIAKFPVAMRSGSSYRDAQPDDPAQAAGYWERCERELLFYRDVAPSVSLVPRAYGTFADPAARRLLLLLEDLSAGEPGDALLGCSTDRAAVVVDMLAAFHAARWEPATQPAWLPRWPGDPTASAVRYRQRAEDVLVRFSDRISIQVMEVALRLIDRYERVLRGLGQRPTTMIHGDLHLDNLIFGNDIASPAVSVIDWQSVASGPAVIDLGLFIVGSLSVADRRAAEGELLARYHRTLVAGGVRGYTFDSLVADYRLALLWQLAGVIGWLGRVDPASLIGRERALVEALFIPGNVFRAIEDHADALHL